MNHKAMNNFGESFTFVRFFFGFLKNQLTVLLI